VETLLTIGEFSRMTHLSVKALRHYHDMGVLEPATIDRFTGYRSYEAGQVPSAQVIRRLRALGMPLDSIRSVLAAPDIDSRNREIAAHLARMERQLEQTQVAVAGLRALLDGPPARPAVELRLIPAVTALAVRDMVGVAGFMDWGTSAFEVLSDTLAASSLTPPDRSARCSPVTSSSSSTPS
jgi:DNA-binding transcriptional MerR regulator